MDVLKINQNMRYVKKASLYYNLSLLAKAQGTSYHHKAYIDLSVEALTKEPKAKLRSLILLEAAISAFKNQNNPKAITFLRQALEDDPNNLNARYLLINTKSIPPS